ncbi:hypothetical protein DB32_001298 [Sandaracinus amylolyticus]|uniref:Uncharacterized protein n=1 Tax=Sandaracinus amylolyticus TaxID=927083 RepID=A0A0F6SDW4_9BACT|nr:hypothetical protein DB32_001298 [Sandaracinus amylolyticus]
MRGGRDGDGDGDGGASARSGGAWGRAREERGSARASRLTVAHPVLRAMRTSTLIT